MIVPIREVGKYGVVKDIPPYAAPFGAWYDARNVEFRDMYVVKASGYQAEHTPSVSPYFLTSVLSGNQTYFVYAGLAKVYGWYGDSEADITRASGDYTGGETDYWNGTMFNGLMVLNNGVDAPQVWNTPSLSTRLTDLPNWPSGTTATIIRSFKNFLVALGVKTASLDDPRMVKWSTDADPGTVPSTWDPADATHNAGEVSLSEGADRLVDCMTLGSVNILYGENSAWVMRYIGYPYIFSFQKLFSSIGLLAQGCVQEFLGRHFVVTMDDIVVHAGGQVESIISHKLRRWLFQNLNPEAVGVARTAKFDQHHEIWFAFPYGNTTVLNMALVWNWELNSWTIVELPNLQHMVGVPLIASAGGTWELASGTWADGGTSEWGTPIMTRSYSGQLYMASAQGGSIYRTAETFQFAGTDFESSLEARGLDIGAAQDGTLFHDAGRRKILRAVWPHIQAPAGTQFTVEASAYDDPGETPGWEASGTWTVGSSPKVDLYTEGRYLAVRFRQTGAVEWKMIGYDLDVEYTGEL